MDKIKFSPELVANSEAKEIVKPNVVRTKYATTPKTKRSGKTPKSPHKKMTSNLAQVLKAEKMARRIEKLSTTEQAKLEKVYTSGPAAYGSARKLQETSKMPKAKIDTFLQHEDAHTKYRQIQRKFPRPKVIAYEINENWSIDVAYVDKVGKITMESSIYCSQWTRYHNFYVLYQCTQEVPLRLLKHSKR